MTTAKSAATATSTRKPAAKKTAAKAAPKPARAAAKPEKKVRQKVKVVRDSFTMPENEYRKIAEIKDACLKAGLPVKKSEVLRAGLQLLAGLSAAKLKHLLGGMEKIKTGRPKKH